MAAAVWGLTWEEVGVQHLLEPDVHKAHPPERRDTGHLCPIHPTSVKGTTNVFGACYIPRLSAKAMGCTLQSDNLYFQFRRLEIGEKGHEGVGGWC